VGLCRIIECEREKYYNRIKLVAESINKFSRGGRQSLKNKGKTTQ